MYRTFVQPFIQCTHLTPSTSTTHLSSLQVGVGMLLIAMLCSYFLFSPLHLSSSILCPLSSALCSLSLLFCCLCISFLSGELQFSFFGMFASSPSPPVLSHLFAECATPDAHQRTFVAAKCMALTGLDLFGSRDLMQKAHHEFVTLSAAQM